MYLLKVESVRFIPCLTSQGSKCSLHFFLLTNQGIVSVRGWMLNASRIKDLNDIMVISLTKIEAS